MFLLGNSRDTYELRRSIGSVGSPLGFAPTLLGRQVAANEPPDRRQEASIADGTAGRFAATQQWGHRFAVLAGEVLASCADPAGHTLGEPGGLGDPVQFARHMGGGTAPWFGGHHP